jgi:Asp-tRNA(Asn)/Glu-tRNA(Gln) amidotransferase A subunit family amidase
MTTTISPPDAFALAAEIRDAKRSVHDLANSMLDRIAARDDLIGAWAYLEPDQVRAHANALDQTEPHGPLHGLPIGIKDVIATKDMPTAYGSPVYAGHRPAADAACVRLLRQAGALILGKTSTVEFASVGAPPRTRNPCAPDHTPGGSSSGSAAAVADGQVPLAIGTQTGGSVIRPASFCGVWAMKPSWGSVSMEGVKPFAPSLDTIGWFGRSPRDLRLLLNALAADRGEEGSPRTLSSARIALWRTPGWDRAEVSAQEALSSLAERLRRAGATVEPIDVPYPELAEDHLAIMYAEGRRSFLPEYRQAPEQLHPRIRAMVAESSASRDRLALAYDRAALARAAYDRLAGHYDGVLSPSAVGPAPEGLEGTGDLLFNGLLTLLHVPVINLPLYRTPAGLPVGVSLSGPRYSDWRLLDLADAVGGLARTA